MKIPNKKELQQIVFNHSLDIDIQDFMYLYKKCTPKSYSFLVIDITLALDNSSRFRKNLLERIWKLIMIIDGKIKYNINREAAKILALLSGEIDKYEYLTGEEIFNSTGRVYTFYFR